MEPTTRRDFVRLSAAAGVTAPFSRVLGANDDIRMAIVGLGSTVKIGGKGKQDLRDFRKVPGVRVVALCDVDRDILDAEAQKFKDRNEPVEAYADVRKLLENKNIDAVVVTTPNHWHALVTVWACQAGKDVYVQKPASHNIFEGRKMVEAAARYSRIVAVPHGPRGATGIGEAIEYARQGNLGRILCVRGLNYRPRTSIGKVAGPQPIPKSIDYDLWSGPAPVVPLRREYLHYDWHWDWLYGNGDLGNMGIHYMDACRWAAGQKTLPEGVIAIGGRFGYDDDGQTPNTQAALLDYKPVPIIFEVRGLPRNRAFRDQNWEANSRLSMDDYYTLPIGVVVHCEKGFVANNQAFDNRGRPVKQFKPSNTGLPENFIRAVRSRKSSDLYSDVLDGHLSAALCHLINISHRVGRQVSSGQIRETVRGEKDFAETFERFLDHMHANRIDLEKQPATLGPWLTLDPAAERFTGAFSERANALLTRDYRRPFVVPEKV